MKPDASLHIGLVGHVIRQMGLKGDMAEEGFSEGLVSLTIACQNYDPSKGLPLSHWLARNIRWGLLNWIDKQKREVPRVSDFLNDAVTRNVFLAQGHPEAGEIVRRETQELLAPQNEHLSMELKEAVALAEQVLSPRERLVVLGKAYGYKGKEIARMLRCSEGQITKLHYKAIAKLKAARK